MTPENSGNFKFDAMKGITNFIQLHDEEKQYNAIFFQVYSDIIQQKDYLNSLSRIIF